MKNKTLDELLLEIELDMASAGARSMMPGEFFGEGYGHTAEQAFASYLSGEVFTLTGGEDTSSVYSMFVVQVAAPEPGESIHAYRERHFAERQEMIDDKMAFTLAYKRPARRPDGTPWVNKAGEPCWWIFGMSAPRGPIGRMN